MRKNNQGYTLVELIVSMAIFSIIAAGVASLIIVGSRFYSNQVISQRLQYEAQLVMTQIQEYVIDAGNGIGWDNNKQELYIVSGSGTSETVSVYQYDSTDKELLFGSCAAQSDLHNGSGKIDTEVACENVDSVSVSFTPVNGDSTRASTVTITVSMSRSDKTYTGTETFALRNEPYYSSTDWSALWSLMHPVTTNPQ